MLRYMERCEAADLIIKGAEGALATKSVTCDFDRLMHVTNLLKYQIYGGDIVENRSSLSKPPRRESAGLIFLLAPALPISPDDLYPSAFPPRFSSGNY